MKKEDIIRTLEKIKQTSKKRAFAQKVDLIINFRDLDLKKPEHQVDTFLALPKNRSKKAKVCALIGPELQTQAKTNTDKFILHDQFATLDKKTIKKLASEYDYFIAQANLMADVAKTFGRILGPRNKMPNPKAGCVVPPNANLQTLVEKLRNTIRIFVKTQLNYKTIVGDENSNPEDVAENILAIHKTLTSTLPSEDKNIKNTLLKLTMGAPEAITKEETA